MLELKNISKKIINKILFQNLTLKIPYGTMFFILGANGTGKTTLLKNLVHLSKITSGEIFLENHPINFFYKKKLFQYISYLPQQYHSSIDSTVYNMIKLGFYNQKNIFTSLNSFDKKYLETILKKMDIEHLKNKLISTLSGGEYQRVFLARLFCSRSKYFLLDEPTSHLDIQHQLEYLQLCKEFKKNYNCSFLITTHDINLASHFADQILLLGDMNTNKYIIGKPKDVLVEKNLKKCFHVNFFPSQGTSFDGKKKNNHLQIDYDSMISN